MANANNPSPGSDRKGVTAMLNSLVSSRELFTDRRDQLEALLETYFAGGGAQAMITAVSQGELEAAIKEPEKYQHIFVRVGGFSARVVRLDPDVQREVLARTLH